MKKLSLVLSCMVSAIYAIDVSEKEACINAFIEPIKQGDISVFKEACHVFMNTQIPFDERVDIIEQVLLAVRIQKALIRDSQNNDTACDQSALHNLDIMTTYVNAMIATYKVVMNYIQSDILKPSA